MKKNPTPKEIEQFEKTARLLNLQRPAPADADIERVIAKLEERLKERGIDAPKNFSVMEGYVQAIDLLKARIIDISKSDIDRLETVQGRAIAMCAMDYLVGMCAEDTLCGVPIKMM